MNEQVKRALAAATNFKLLKQLEANARERIPFDDEMERTFKRQADLIAREEVIRRTGIDVSQITPAEEKIIRAASEYLAIKRRAGSDANRTIAQIKKHGPIEAAERSVSTARPTQGFTILHEEELDELSYEQIVVEHPEEFSPRAIWFAQRTLKLPNDILRPPARPSIPAQIRTEELVKWLSSRAEENQGVLPSFSNADASSALGMADLTRHGRVFGNIQSRLDFACFRLNLPPLGLAAEQPFAQAWQQEDRTWSFPLDDMQRAARSFRWQRHDFENLIAATRTLSGQAHLLWKTALRDDELKVRNWAQDLAAAPRLSPPLPITGTSEPTTHNPKWTREEHILGLDLYLRLRNTSFPETHPDVIALSEMLNRLAKIRGLTGSPTFRNATGVSMKMLNFRRWDTEHSSSGLPGGAELEKTVWTEFADKPTRLALAVNTIVDQIADVDDVKAPPDAMSVIDASVTELEAHIFSDLLPASEAIEPAKLAGDVLASDRLALIERRFLEATPEAKIYLAEKIERGPVGRLVKRINKFRCQICQAMGEDPISFRKKNGDPYVEAHHVMPVHRRELGSLSATNIVTVCANHHRELHYGEVSVEVGEREFVFVIGNQRITVEKTSIMAERFRPTKT